MPIPPWHPTHPVARRDVERHQAPAAHVQPVAVELEIVDLVQGHVGLPIQARAGPRVDRDEVPARLAAGGVQGAGDEQRVAAQGQRIDLPDDVRPERRVGRAVGAQAHEPLAEQAVDLVEAATRVPPAGTVGDGGGDVEHRVRDESPACCWP